jgi:tRNA-dihydrouridine synthase B
VTTSNKIAAKSSLVVGGVVLPHAAILAPMSGVTDLPFRQAVRRCGGGLVVTEMIASAAVLFEVRSELRKLKSVAWEEFPLSIQLAGWDPLVMAEAAKICEGLGATFIDINMGCPAKKITGKLSGSALMRDLPLATAIMQAVKSAVSVPVTLKMRLGWDNDSLNAVELGQIAEDIGLSMIAVHGRTRCQMYSGKADWSKIAAVVDAVSIPVIANGDIRCLNTAANAIAASGAAGLMLGRGAQGHPWLLAQIGDFLAGQQVRASPSIQQRHHLLRMHLNDMIAYYDSSAMRLARKHIAWYSHGLPGAAELRDKANNTADAAEVFRAVEWFFQNLASRFEAA